MKAEIIERTDEQLARAIPASVRKRLMLGQFETGEDVAALRRFVGLTQEQFASAMGISVPELGTGPASPRGTCDRVTAYCGAASAIIRENVASMSAA